MAARKKKDEADVVAALDGEIPVEPGIDAEYAQYPAPIHPSSTPSQQNDRVSFENLVNEGAALFAAEAHAAYIEATLAGNSISLVTN